MKVLKIPFGTATLKPYRTVNTHPKLSFNKIGLPQNVQYFFSGLFVLSYVDWVLLHRKMLKTSYFKWVFTKFFGIFEKTGFFTFFKKSSKSCFWSILTSNSDRASKIRWGGCFWTYQNLFYGKIQKIKFFNFFRKKVITQKNELCSYSAPLFILAHSTSEKT